MLARKHLEAAQNEIEKKIIRFSSLISDTVYKSFEAILSRNIIAAKEIVAADEAIDAEQRVIEDYCVRTIATEQPVATDLRYFLANIKAVSIYEKIADYAKTMCRKLEFTTQQQIDNYTPHIQNQRKIIFKMLDGTIEAMIQRDVDHARKTAQLDSEVDQNYRKTTNEIIHSLDSSATHSQSTLEFLYIIRTFERIGDMLSIINELTVYIVTGQHEDLN